MSTPKTQFIKQSRADRLKRRGPGGFKGNQPLRNAASRRQERLLKEGGDAIPFGQGLLAVESGYDAVVYDLGGSTVIVVGPSASIDEAAGRSQFPDEQANFPPSGINEYKEVLSASGYDEEEACKLGEALYVAGGVGACHEAGYEIGAVTETVCGAVGILDTVADEISGYEDDGSGIAPFVMLAAKGAMKAAPYAIEAAKKMQTGDPAPPIIQPQDTDDESVGWTS